MINQELETSLQKIDTLRQDIRKAEKLRRELELRAEDSLNEAAKERKMREKAEKELNAFRGGESEGGGGVPASEVHNCACRHFNDITMLTLPLYKVGLILSVAMVCLDFVLKFRSPVGQGRSCSIRGTYQNSSTKYSVT